jgi:hypothetical protein
MNVCQIGAHAETHFATGTRSPTLELGGLLIRAIPAKPGEAPGLQPGV